MEPHAFSLFSTPALFCHLPKVLKKSKQQGSGLTSLLISKPFVSVTCPVLPPGATILERTQGPEAFSWMIQARSLRPVGSAWMPAKWPFPATQPLQLPGAGGGLGALGNSTLSPCLWEL